MRSCFVHLGSTGRCLVVDHSPRLSTAAHFVFASASLPTDDGCFEESVKIAARKMKIRLPEETALDAEVDLCKTGEDYFLQARLNVSGPGLDRSVAQEVVDAAEQICTYSKAIRGNVDVTIKLV
jgi:hypothetical protein